MEPSEIAVVDRIEVVKAARAGDAEAFGLLVREEAPRLRRAARAIVGDLHEAEDAAHDALLRAWRALPKLADPARFGPWLSRILVREALRRARRRPRAAPLTDDRPAAPAPEEDPRLEALRREVARLPAKYRVLLALHYLGGRSLAETVAVVGLSPARVKSRLFEARRLLRRRLNDAP